MSKLTPREELARQGLSSNDPAHLVAEQRAFFAAGRTLDRGTQKGPQSAAHGPHRPPDRCGRGSEKGSWPLPHGKRSLRERASFRQAQDSSDQRGGWARPELVLPILSCPSLDEAIRRINSRAPLAPYLFSKSREEADRYGPHCHFGGDCVNDTFSRLISTQGSPLAEWAKAAWAAPTAAGASSPFPTKKASCGALHCGYSPALSALCRQGLGVEHALAPGGLGHNLPGAERLRKALHSQGTAQGVPASPSLRCPTLNYEKNHKTKERCISNSYNKKEVKNQRYRENCHKIVLDCLTSQF